LREAQELLDKQGQVNAILALECLCVGKDGLPKIREEIGRILPGTQVIERGSKALARAETRFKSAEEAHALLAEEKQHRAHLREVRETFAAVFASVAIAVCGVWIVLLGFLNVRQRRAEIGILRAVGMRSVQILALMLSKSLAMGCVGAILGILGGVALGRYLGLVLEGGGTDTVGQGLVSGGELLFAWLVSCLLAVAAGWVPAVHAARQDPARILAEE